MFRLARYRPGKFHSLYGMGSPGTVGPQSISTWTSIAVRELDSRATNALVCAGYNA